MPVQAQRYCFDSALLLRQRDLAPEEYAVYLIEVIGAALVLRWSALKQGQFPKS